MHRRQSASEILNLVQFKFNYAYIWNMRKITYICDLSHNQCESRVEPGIFGHLTKITFEH